MSGTDPFVEFVADMDWLIAKPAGGGPRPGTDDPEDLDIPKIGDSDDLDRFLFDRLQIRLPATVCCEKHSTPHAAFHEAYFAQHPVTVWKASRGFGGKSFTLALLAFVEAVTLRADVNVLGGTGEQSKRVLEAMTLLWETPTAPRKALIGEPGSQKQKLIWRNRIVALMASQASVRGPHPQRLRLDEVDEMGWGILDSALGQPMSKGWILSQVVMSSTHQYPNGTMTKVLQLAATKGWPVREWCLHETMEPHGWLTKAEVERKRIVMTVQAWDTEVLLQEPSSEGRAFDTNKVQAAFVPMDPVRVEKDTLVFEEPVEGGKYSTGGDWAKKVNWTVIVTIRHDVTPARVVCVTRTQKEPWPTMVARYDAQVQHYGGTACHDNTGLGTVVADLLNVSAEDFNMVGRQRADLLSNYVASVEHGDVIWPRLDDNVHLASARSEHVYATRDDLYRGTKDGSGKFHLPDTISAGALAWRACSGVEAASAMEHPNEQQGGPLQQGIKRGRLSSYIRGGR